MPKISKSQYRLAAKAYASGKTIAEAAEENGMSSSSLWNYIHENKMSRKKHSFSHATMALAFALFGSGLPIDEIAKKIKVSAPTIRSWIIDAELERELPSGLVEKRKNAAMSRKEAIIDYCSPHSFADAARKFGLPVETICECFFKVEHSKRFKNADKNPLSAVVELKDLAIGYYVAGLTMADAAKKAHVGLRTLSRWLKEEAVPVRPAGRGKNNYPKFQKRSDHVSADRQKEIADYYLAGNSLQATGNKFGVAASSVSRFVRNIGGVIRDRGDMARKRIAEGRVEFYKGGPGEFKSLSEAKKRRIYRLYVGGANGEQVAEKLGLHKATVFKVLKEAGLTRTPTESNLLKNRGLLNVD